LGPFLIHNMHEEAHGHHSGTFWHARCRFRRALYSRGNSP
jgi:hypothetical protein